MTDYAAIFVTAENQNWAKYALAVHIARDGLLDFVKSQAAQLQADLIKNNLQKPLAPVCTACTTADVVPCRSSGICTFFRGKCKFHTSVSKKCPRRLCNKIRTDIEKEHRYYGPSWKNTNAKAWCTNAWEIAKCFFPPDGYLDKTTAEETDFNGILSFILNCKRFDNLLPGLRQHNSIFHQVGNCQK